MRLLRSTVLLGCLDWHALLPSWSSETMLVPSRALAANADLSPPNAVIVYPSLPFVFFTLFAILEMLHANQNS